MGFFNGDYERIDTVLRQADSISVRTEMAQIGDLQCYVIDAATKRGKYTVWIDPEHGYNIAKAEVRRSGDRNDLHYGTRLKKDDNIFTSLENVRFERIDDVWVPMEADIEVNRNHADRIHYRKAKNHHKRT